MNVVLQKVNYAQHAKQKQYCFREKKMKEDMYFSMVYAHDVINLLCIPRLY